MADRPFVTRIHVEPEECRQDLEDPEWDVVARLLQTLGVGPARRLELSGPDSLTVMTVEAHGEAFHISIQVGETRYYCLRSAADTNGEVEELGPFAFDAAEVCRSRATMTDVVRAFWARGERTDAPWNEYDASNALSPLNNTMAKASAEVGGMWQAFKAGDRGGDAKLRVRGKWKASPATRADMKLIARWLELTELMVIDSDGTLHTFEGNELMPTAAGGKRWVP